MLCSISDVGEMWREWKIDRLTRSWLVGHNGYMVPELVHQFSVRFTPRSGRPKALKQRQLVGLIERILRLERDGYSRSVAMRSAAREFRVSFRYAQRAWRIRKRILSGSPDFTLEEALQWIGSKIKAEQNTKEIDSQLLISLPVVIEGVE